MIKQKAVLESFLGGKIKVYQPCNGYKSGSDAVLLASIVPNNMVNVLELGCGVGVASLCLGTRLINANIVGIEKEDEFFSLAKKNIQLNNRLQSKFSIKHHNIKDILLSKNYSDYGNFDAVMMNPPYYTNLDNINKNILKQIGNIEGDAKLSDFIRLGFLALKNSGYLFIIMQTSRLQELMCLFEPRYWGGIEIFPIYSYSHKQAKRFIIKAKKLSKSPTILHSGIVMHNEDGSYTNIAEDILRKGKIFDNNNY